MQGFHHQAPESAVSSGCAPKSRNGPSSAFHAWTYSHFISRPQPCLVLDQGSEMVPWLLGLPIRLKLFTVPQKCHSSVNQLQAMRSAKYIKRCPSFMNEKFLKYLPKVLQRSSFPKILFGRHLSNGASPRISSFMCDKVPNIPTWAATI